MDGSEGVLGYDPVWIATVQRRGTVTVPIEVRQRMDLPDGSRLLMIRTGADTLVARVLPPPAVWFARDEGAVASEAVAELRSGSPDRLPTRWLSAEAVLGAQAYPASPIRTWFTELDQGFHTVQVDPLMIADLLERLPRLLPPLSRPDRAGYLLPVLHWRGITLADRPFYSAALVRWGATDASWAAVVQEAREGWGAEEL